VSSHRVVRVGLPTQAIVLAAWDRCPYGLLLPGELCAGRGKSHSVTTAVGALRAEPLAKKLPPAPGSGCRPALAPKVTAGMSGPATATASAIPPAIHDDNDLGMTVLAQGSHSTGPAPAGRAGLMS
jgi:hypothetical protein